MKRIFEIGLTGGVILSTLAFGGTEMPYFSVVQITILGLGVLLFATYNSAFARDSRLPVVIPPANALVFAVVLGLAYANSSRRYSVALANSTASRS
jgi:hypothetical protein